MTRFIDVPAMSRLVRDIGVSQFIGELADAIRQDFVQWPDSPCRLVWPATRPSASSS